MARADEFSSAEGAWRRLVELSIGRGAMAEVVRRLRAARLFIDATAWPAWAASTGAAPAQIAEAAPPAPGAGSITHDLVGRS